MDFTFLISIISLKFRVVVCRIRLFPITLIYFQNRFGVVDGSWQLCLSFWTWQFNCLVLSWLCFVKMLKRLVMLCSLLLLFKQSVIQFYGIQNSWQGKKTYISDTFNFRGLNLKLLRYELKDSSLFWYCYILNHPLWAFILGWIPRNFQWSCHFVL